MSAGYRIAVAAVAMVLGCDEVSATTDVERTCSDPERAPLIVGGGSVPAVVTLSHSERAAVAALFVGTDPAGLCSAVIFAPGRALSAAHCAPAGVELELAFGHDAGNPTATSAVHWVVPHPTLDVGVFGFEMPPCFDVAGVPLFEGDVDSSAVGRPAEIAGFGWTSSAGAVGPGERQFAATTIVAVEPEHLVVEDVEGKAACAGDSGGPLLIDSEGGPRVAGILDHGDAGCDGRDFYTRADQIRHWASGN